MAIQPREAVVRSSGSLLMLIDFRRGYMAWRLTLCVLVATLGAAGVYASFHEPGVFLVFSFWLITMSLPGLIRYTLILANPGRCHLTVSDDALELKEPFFTERVSWKSVTHLGFDRELDRVNLLRLYFDGPETSTRKARWTGFKNFALKCRWFDIDPYKLVEIIRSHVEAQRADSRKPLKVVDTFSIGSQWTAYTILALGAFARLGGQAQERADRDLQRAVGASFHERKNLPIETLIQRYPKDPRVRLRFAEKLIDENRVTEAVQELRAVHADYRTLQAFDGESRYLRSEVMAVMAEALLKRNRAKDAHDVVGPVCSKLDSETFEKMRKLKLCRYSWEPKLSMR